MMPRSCLEDMTWEYSSTTEIGEYQVAAGGWGGAARRLFQSVTVTRQNRVLLLQIEINESVPSENLDL